MMGRSFLALLGIASLLSGCVAVWPSARITLVDRTNGEEYGGTTSSTGRTEGDLSAVVEGANYSGHWIYSANGGAYTIGSGITFARGAAAVGTGSALAVSAQGNGLVNMRDPTGRFIRCVFNFNGFSNSGIGECQRNDGREYDLRIHR